MSRPTPRSRRPGGLTGTKGNSCAGAGPRRTAPEPALSGWTTCPRQRWVPPDPARSRGPGGRPAPEMMTSLSGMMGEAWGEGGQASPPPVHKRSLTGICHPHRRLECRCITGNLPSGTCDGGGRPGRPSPEPKRSLTGICHPHRRRKGRPHGKLPSAQARGGGRPGRPFPPGTREASRESAIRTGDSSAGASPGI